jgi:hypothetical protein
LSKKKKQISKLSTTAGRFLSLPLRQKVAFVRYICVIYIPNGLHLFITLPCAYHAPRQYRIRSPPHAINHGFSYITETTSHLSLYELFPLAVFSQLPEAPNSGKSRIAFFSRTPFLNDMNVQCVLFFFSEHMYTYKLVPHGYFAGKKCGIHTTSILSILEKECWSRI